MGLGFRVLFCSPSENPGYIFKQSVPWTSPSKVSAQSNCTAEGLTGYEVKRQACEAFQRVREGKRMKEIL